MEHVWRVVRLVYRFLRPVPQRTIEECLIDLHRTRQKVVESVAQLEAAHADAQTSARAHASSGNLGAAREALRLGQLYDRRLEAGRRTVTALSAHMLTLESTRLNRLVVQSLRNGSVAVGVPALTDETLDRIEQQYDDSSTLSELLTESPVYVDEEAVDVALRALVPYASDAVLALPVVPEETWIPSKSSSSEAEACEASPMPAC